MERFHGKKLARLIVAVLVSLSLLVGAEGCEKSTSSSSASSSSSVSSSSGTRVVTDMEGTKVTIPSNVTSIGTNGNAMTEIIALCGGLSKLKATTPAVKSSKWYLKLYPKLQNAAAPFDTQVNIEELVNAHPDVVTLWTGNDELKKKIESVGIPVVVFNYNNAKELKQAVTLMGNILGGNGPAIAKQYIAYYEKNIKKVSDIFAKAKIKTKKRVYYVTSSPTSTEGENSISNAWIGMANGVNVATKGGIKDLTATVSIEQIASWDPEVIIIRDPQNYSTIMNSSAWKNITAVKNKQVFINPAGLNVWCARSADEALQPLWAAKTIYPKLFKSINVEKEAKYFYKTFYHHTLTAEELNEVMNPS